MSNRHGEFGTIWCRDMGLEYSQHQKALEIWRSKLHIQVDIQDYTSQRDLQQAKKERSYDQGKAV